MRVNLAPHKSILRPTVRKDPPTDKEIAIVKGFMSKVQLKPNPALKAFVMSFVAGQRNEATDKIITARAFTIEEYGNALKDKSTKSLKSLDIYVT